MNRLLFILAFVLALTVSTARADYMQLVGWEGNIETTCQDLLNGNQPKMFNLNLNSDITACVPLATTYNLWVQGECYSNGTAHIIAWYADTCDPDDAFQPAFTYPIKPATWLQPQCWIGSENPVPVTYTHAMCIQGTVPGAPVPPSTPVTAPVTPTPVPVSPNPTAPTSTPTPVATPTASPVPVAAPVPTAAPATPPTTAPITPPTAAPITPPTAPTPTDPIVGQYIELLASSTASCASPIPSSSYNITSAGTCIPYGGVYVSLDCTERGYPFGIVCTDDICQDCVGTGYNPPQSTQWDVPRCLNQTAGGYSATCRPVYESQVPLYTPVPDAPSPVTPTPIDPVPAPTGPTVTVDWAAEFGKTCGNPTLFGQFTNSTACQAVYTGGGYAVAYCTPSGNPVGRVCSNNQCNPGSGGSACTNIPTTSPVTWGQSVCVTTPQNLAISLKCNNHTTPPPPPAPIAPEAPVAPPVSSGLPVIFGAFLDNTCKQRVQVVSLKANISLCQSVVAFTSTTYLKADCYANGTVHGAMCANDKTCTQCTPLPPAPSGLCVPYSFASFINSVQINCTIPPPPRSSPTGGAPSIAPLPFLISLLLAVFALVW